MAIIIRPEDIERIMAESQPLASNALDYFKRRPMKASAYADVMAIEAEVGNVPVIHRGDTGIRPRMDTKNKLIEPMPIELDDTFTAVELDDYERASSAGKQQLIDDKLSIMFNIVRETTRALCSQACNGKIDYMMKAGNQLVRYVVEYGTVAKLTTSKSAGSVTVGDIIATINLLVQTINNQQVGGPVDFVAGKTLFAGIVNVVSSQRAFNAAVGVGYVDIGGFRIMLDIDSYTDIAANGTRSTKTMVGDTQLMARALNAGQSMPYYKLDDVVLRETVPFYSFTKDRSDQRGTDVYAKSKPLPLVNTKGIAIMEFAA